MELYNKELSKFFNDYSLNCNNEDYKVKFDLSYWKGFRNELKCRSYFKSLRNYFKRDNIEMNGIYVNEFSKDYFIHNHSLIWFNCSWELGKRMIWDYCIKYKVGSCVVDEYKRGGGYNFYISKFLGLSEKNNYELIELL